MIYSQVDKVVKLRVQYIIEFFAIFHVMSGAVLSGFSVWGEVNKIALWRENYERESLQNFLFTFCLWRGAGKSG